VNAYQHSCVHPNISLIWGEIHKRELCHLNDSTDMVPTAFVVQPK
jgi:hypothetical protein